MDEVLLGEKSGQFEGKIWRYHKFLADEQSAQGWTRSKGTWLCAGSSSPTDVKAAPGNAHLSIGEFSAGPLVRLRTREEHFDTGALALLSGAGVGPVRTERPA